jgi:outer membrane biosynthesis protein TonB
MEQPYSFNEMGIVEVLAPDGTKLTVAQSLELFRRQILDSMRLMTDKSAANLALLYAVKHFAVPQMQASHWETVGKLLETSEDNDANNALKDLTEMMLGEAIERVQPEPDPEPEIVIEDEPIVEDPFVEDPIIVEPVIVDPVVDPIVVEPQPEPTPEPQPEPTPDPAPEPTPVDPTVEVPTDPAPEVLVTPPDPAAE